MPLPAGPLPVTNPRIIEDVVGQMRFALLGDQPDLELSDRHPCVAAIEVGIHPRARLKLQHLICFVKRPDAREGRAKMLDHRLGAPLKAGVQAVALGKRDADLRRKNRLARPLSKLRLCLLSVADIREDGHTARDGALPVSERRGR